MVAVDAARTFENVSHCILLLRYKVESIVNINIINHLAVLVVFFGFRHTSSLLVVDLLDTLNGCTLSAIAEQYG